MYKAKKDLTPPFHMQEQLKWDKGVLEFLGRLFGTLCYLNLWKKPQVLMFLNIVSNLGFQAAENAYFSMTATEIINVMYVLIKIQLKFLWSDSDFISRFSCYPLIIDVNHLILFILGRQCVLDLFV